MNQKQRIEILILLNSKESTLRYLHRTKRYTSHEIFGNIINEGLKVLKNLPCYHRSTKVIFAKRKRGYDDKGSQRPKEKWLPSHDILFTTEQNYKEKKSNLRLQTVSRILKILEDSNEIEKS